MTLPYRTDGQDLERFIEALARGRTLDQIQTLNFSQKGFEGTVTAAEALGFASRDDEGLTELGRRFALASTDERRRILLEAMRGYEPFALLLEAIQDRDEGSTETEWVETWWSTHGFGSSGSNRREGSSALARLLEYAGVGSYLQGRRGHPSRIEWKDGAFTGDVPAPEDARESVSVAAEREAPQMATSTKAVPRTGATEARSDSGPSIELSMPLSEGRTIYMRLPHELSDQERTRLFALLEHLVPTKAEG